MHSATRRSQYPHNPAAEAAAAAAAAAGEWGLDVAETFWGGSRVELAGRRAVYGNIYPPPAQLQVQATPLSTVSGGAPRA